MEVQALSLLAGSVVVDRAGAVERCQHLPGENLVDLAVRDVRGVDDPKLSPLPQRKTDRFSRPPFPIQNLAPALGRAGKQVQLKVVCGSFPAHAVAALFPVFEHVSIAENTRQSSQAVATGLSVSSPPRLAASVSRLPALLAGHNIFIRPPHSCLVGARSLRGRRRLCRFVAAASPLRGKLLWPDT